MKKGRFEIAKSWSHISGHPEGGCFIYILRNVFEMFNFCISAPLPEVRILVDGTGDEAGHSLLVSKDEGEGGGKAGGSLDGGEADFPNRTAVIEAENSLHLVVSHTFLNLDNILVKRRTLTHEGEVGEDECLLDVESKCNDIFNILSGKPHSFILLEVFPQKLLIVSHLDY